MKWGQKRIIIAVLMTILLVTIYILNVIPKNVTVRPLDQLRINSMVPKPTKQIVSAIKKTNINDLYSNKYDQIIADLCSIYGVDDILATAISRLETGNYTSDIFVTNNNFGGLLGVNGYYSYDSKQSGAESFVKLIKWYNDKGMTNPELMGSLYCPPGDDWAILVNELMTEQKKRRSNE